MSSLRDDMEVRKTAVVMGSVLEKIKIIYEHDEVLAGKLAIAYLEQALTGGNSFEGDWVVNSQLTELAKQAEISANKYETRVRRSLDKQREKIEELATMLSEGMTQKDIAKKWGVSSGRVSQIKKEGMMKYPELFGADDASGTDGFKF